MRDRAFAVGDGFDLYVDAARFLPDNVTLSSIEAFVTDRCAYVCVQGRERE